MPQALVADVGIVRFVLALALSGPLVAAFPTGQLKAVRRHPVISRLEPLLLSVIDPGTRTRLAQGP
ncbi:MAG: hypothetical protein ACREOD_01500 [Candidatus Dormibacteria bacterium]